LTPPSSLTSFQLLPLAKKPRFQYGFRPNPIWVGHTLYTTNHLHFSELNSCKMVNHGYMPWNLWLICLWCLTILSKCAHACIHPLVGCIWGLISTGADSHTKLTR
jgi:hypothetical protein